MNVILSKGGKVHAAKTRYYTVCGKEILWFSPVTQEEVNCKQCQKIKAK